MKKTKHEKFLQELRAPVLKAERAQCSRKTSGFHPLNVCEAQRRQFSKRPDPFDVSLEEDGDILAEFEALFDGTDDDDD